MNCYEHPLRVVSLNDGCVHVCELVKIDRWRSVQVLLLNLTIGLLVPQDQVNLHLQFTVNF